MAILLLQPNSSFRWSSTRSMAEATYYDSVEAFENGRIEQRTMYLSGILMVSDEGGLVTFILFCRWT